MTLKAADADIYVKSNTQMARLLLRALVALMCSTLAVVGYALVTPALGVIGAWLGDTLAVSETVKQVLFVVFAGLFGYAVAALYLLLFGKLLSRYSMVGLVFALPLLVYWLLAIRNTNDTTFAVVVGLNAVALASIVVVTIVGYWRTRGASAGG